MKKMGRESIQSIIKRACKEFLEDISAPDFVMFNYKGHTVRAYFEWSRSRRCWYLKSFDVLYSRCIMKYFVNNDFDLSSAWCE